MNAAPRLRIDQDEVFRALGHPVRRRILDLLRKRPRTTGEVADAFAMTRFGVMKHLEVLTGAGLVLVERRGRERWNHLNAAPLLAVERRWISRFARGPAERLLRLRDAVEGVSEMTDVTQTPFGVVEVVSEVLAAAPPERVWSALTERIGDWWPAAFFSSPEAKRMVLEARLGGRVYEDWGRGDGSGLLWYTVIGLVPGRDLRLSGELTPDFGGPARLATRWTLVAEGDGTRVRVVETAYGRVSPETGRHMTEGWNQILGEHLRPFAEAQP